MSSHFVIVAQPDWNLRNVLRQHLDGIGFRTLVTPTAAEAEDFAARVVAALVILDIELPGITGYETCVRIRRMPGYAGVPIVLLTGQDLPRRRAAAGKAGADVLLVKPFSMNDLMREVEPLLSGSAAPGGAPAAPPPVTVWAPSPPLQWRFGEGSELSVGKRMLDMLRPASRR